MSTLKRKDKIKTGVGILNLIENHSIIGISREHIGNWTQIVSKEASKTAEDLSFAKKMCYLLLLALRFLIIHIFKYLLTFVKFTHFPALKFEIYLLSNIP